MACNKELTFIFDNIDPVKGPLPNILFETLASNHSYEDFLKKIFSDFDVKFKPSYYVDDEFKWLYPIFINNLVYMNSILHIERILPPKVVEGVKQKKGKIIVFILEPVTDNYHLMETLFYQETPDYIYCTRHASSIKNVFNYDPTILERSKPLHHLKDKDVESRILHGYDDRIFSCFLYFYMDCPTRLIFMSFLETDDLLDKIFISAAAQGKKFDSYLKTLQNTDLGPFDANFSSFSKVFDTLNISEALEKSLINIIFEAEVLYSSAQSLLSEKVFRSIEAEKPFILFAHPEALKYFRELGFRSFSPFIDESYDLHNDPKKRIKIIFREIKRLSQIPINELKDELKNLQPIFDHNKKVLLSMHSNTQTNIYKELCNGLQQ